MGLSVCGPQSVGCNTLRSPHTDRNRHTHTLGHTHTLQTPLRRPPMQHAHQCSAQFQDNLLVKHRARGGPASGGRASSSVLAALLWPPSASVLPVTRARISPPDSMISAQPTGALITLIGPAKSYHLPEGSSARPPPANLAHCFRRLARARPALPPCQLAAASLPPLVCRRS